MHDRKLWRVEEELRKITPQCIDTQLSLKNVLIFDVDQLFRLVFVLLPKFKLADVRKNIEDLEFENIIMVSREKLSSTNIKSIADIGKHIQVYDLKELQFNISKHALIPKHELIGGDQEELIQELIQRHNLKTRLQFPLILKTDPMAKYLNAKPGNLVKITRFSPTSGEHVVYRCCI